MSGTALTYITQAFLNLNVFQPGATIPTAMANDALVRLNAMISSWAQGLTPWSTSVDVTGLLPYPKGSPGFPYSWQSPGGDFGSPKPANQNSVVAASLLLGGPPIVPTSVEVQLTVLTDQMYASITMKALQSAQPTAVYYVPTSPYGTLYLWPIPTDTHNGLVLYREERLAPFADLNTTTYFYPDGYDEALVYNLERRLAGPYGREMPAEDAILARETFANIMRSNQRLSDLPNDFAGVFGGGSSYDIERGE